MALSDPLQLLSILAIVVVIFIFGPQKIPEIARSIGRARKELDSASKEFQQITKELQNPAAILERFSVDQGQVTQAKEPPAAQTALPITETKTDDQLLIETAGKLGISTSGKTREEISAEIARRANGGRSQDSSANSPAPSHP